MTGSFLIETIFDINGFGLLGFKSVMDRDIPVVMGVFLLSAGLMLLGISLIFSWHWSIHVKVQLRIEQQMKSQKLSGDPNGRLLWLGVGGIGGFVLLGGIGGFLGGLLGVIFIESAEQELVL